MRKGVDLILGVVLGLSVVSTSSAEQWQIVGPRALGIGGAHVAVVNDATASYWNPAAYGFFGRQTEVKDEHYGKDWGVHIHAGVGVQLHEDVAEEVDDILEYDFDDLAGKAEAGTIALDDLDDFIQLVAEVKDLEQDDMGLTATADLGFNVRFKNFGIGVYSLGEIAATDPVVDLNNLGIEGGMAADAIDNLILSNAPSYPPPTTVLSIPQRDRLITEVGSLSEWAMVPNGAQDFVYSLDRALDGAGVTSVPDDVIDAAIEVAEVANELEAGGTGDGNLDDNNSSILFKGANIIEIPITYGYAFNDNLSLGGNLKFMRARVYYTQVKVFDQEEDDFLEDAYDNYEESNNFGIDLGVLGKYKDFRVGLVGRNLNRPKFDYAGSGDYEIDPQLRAGIAYIPASWITLAADVDITENDTPLSGYDSQNLGGGIELKIWDILSLRGGAYTNLAESDVIYTAGLGIDIFGFNLDVGAAVSDSRSELDDDKIPEQARAELAISLQY